MTGRGATLFSTPYAVSMEDAAAHAVFPRGLRVPLSPAFAFEPSLRPPAPAPEAATVAARVRRRASLLFSSVSLSADEPEGFMTLPALHSAKAVSRTPSQLGGHAAGGRAGVRRRWHALARLRGAIAEAAIALGVLQPEARVAGPSGVLPRNSLRRLRESFRRHVRRLADPEALEPTPRPEGQDADVGTVGSEQPAGPPMYRTAWTGVEPVSGRIEPIATPVAVAAAVAPLSPALTSELQPSRHELDRPTLHAVLADGEGGGGRVTSLLPLSLSLSLTRSQPVSRSPSQTTSSTFSTQTATAPLTSGSCSLVSDSS